MGLGKNSVTEANIRRWLTEVFKAEDLENIDFVVTGTSEKGDGYVGDIYFVKMTATNNNNQTKLYDLVIKSGKIDEALREKMPVRLAFEREIFVYGKAVPSLRQFETVKGVNVIDSVLPKCFGTLLYNDQEVLVFQNLKSIGFDLHDRYEPLDLDHLKITLENYGKWHGLSIAYRHQYPEEFHQLFDNLQCVFSTFIVTWEEAFPRMEKAMYAILESNNEGKLVEDLKKHFQNGLGNSLLDLLKNKEDNCVFLHGDCWNNNMMFKYEGSTPKEVRFLDFQISKLGSPVDDLAYHIYTTCSEKELLHFKDLLQTYYNSLSKTIRNLGGDPEKLFPYTELVRQWKKRALYGVCMVAMAVPLILSDKEDTIDIQDMNSDLMDEVLEKVRQKNNDRISPRVVAAVRHFLSYNDF